MNSKELRTSPALLRNAYPCTKEHGIPIIQADTLHRIDRMLSFHDIRKDDPMAKEIDILVHFFKDDNKFEYMYRDAFGRNSESKVTQLAQYTAVCTPDFSLYPDMPYPIQLDQVFKNRWCGAHWQAAGLNVLPTISWGDESSYDFCFEGIPAHATVVVSTVGCQKSRRQFLAGYDEMLNRLQPETIICYGNPFQEMDGNILSYPYSAFRKGEFA